MPNSTTALTIPSQLDRAHTDLTLSQLEVLVDKHFAAFQNFGRRTVEEAWQVGHHLNQAKALVGHGGWYDWLDERGVANQTANRFMQLSQHFDIPQLGGFESVQAALESAKKPHVAHASGE